MVRMVYKIITGLIIALGLLHTAFTWHNYDEINLDAVWFFGTGVAIILAGFLNVVLIRVGSKDKLILVLCLITNIFFATLFVLALFLLKQPQVFLGSLLFFTAIILSAKTGQQ